jgi:hypothetical protein
MPQPPRPDQPAPRPSDRTPPPDGVTDRLLWALAVDVAAAHQPGPDGSCTNPQCRGQRGTCWPLRTARRAAHLARRTATNGPHTPPQPPAPLPRRRAAGGGSVAPEAQRFINWFATNPAPATPNAPAAVPTPVLATFAPLRRPPAAAPAA